MGRVPIAPLLVLTALTAGLEAAPAVGPQADPQPIATRQTIFAIPFQIEKAQLPAQEPTEVRLYYSTDRGATWNGYARVEPSAGHFLFRAVGDGEYCFLVRTVDRSGQVRPQAPNRPELRVLVDTTPPTLDLTAERGDAGQITVRWKESDLAPKRESLKIQYRCAPDVPNAPWQPVAIDWRTVKVDGPAQTGEVTFWPPAGAAHLEIEGEAADLAGNRAVSHAQVDTRQMAAAPGDDGDAPSRVTDSGGQPWRPARSDGPPYTRPAAHPIDTPSGQGWGTVPGQAAEDRTTSAGTATEGPAADVDRRTQPPADSVAGTVNPAVRNQYVPPAGGPAPADTGLPAAQRPRWVNSKVFELEYDSGPVGASALGWVELWGTQDDGRSWTSFGRDPDGRSPMLVTVPEEGVYGFRVVAQGDPRMAPRPPRSGDAPDVWIGVDLTRPAARIVSAERESGPGGDRLVIRWEASDATLAPRPVSLFYSAIDGGGWSTIASGLENAGVYPWPLDPRLPGWVYLRLEVRDEAGNLAVFETPQAVDIEQQAGGVRQEQNGGVRIRDVRPVGQSVGRFSGGYLLR